MKKICKGCGKEFNAKKSRLVCCSLKCSKLYKKSDEYRNLMKSIWLNRTQEEKEAIRKKKEDTVYKKTGKKYTFQLDEVKNKIRQTSFKRYGVFNAGGSIQSIKKAKLKRDANKSSILEIKWLDSLNIKERQKDIIIDNKYIYFVDGYDEKTNTIYEFLGDFWHGNPNPLLNKGRIFTENSINFIRTKQRFFMLVKAGYNIRYIWENDFKNNKYLEGRIFKDRLEYL